MTSWSFISYGSQLGSIPGNLGKITKNANSEFPDFRAFTLDMKQSRVISRNLGIHPISIFCDFPKKSQFRLGNENFEISRNSAYAYNTNYGPQIV